MRFNVLLTTFLLFALASGLVVPPRVSKRGLDSVESRQFFIKDFDDVNGRSIFGLVKGALGAVKGVAKAAKGVIGAVKGVVSKAGSVAKKAGTAAKGVASKTKGVAKSASNKVKAAGNKVKDSVKGPKNKYTVPAGGGKPAQTYSRQDVKNAVKNANTEHQRHKSGTMSNTQKKKSPLKPFNNNNHRDPKAGSPGPNSLPKMKGPGHEYPLRNAAQGPATPKDKGPARVITQENKAGKLKFKGVVAHDQSRGPGHVGANDHFQIKGTRK